MALTNLAVFGGSFFTPIVVGKITHTIGWRWSFYFVAIFSGVCAPLVFLFVPETAFRRSAYLNTDMASSEDVRLHPATETSPTQQQNGSNASGTDAVGDTSDQADAEKANQPEITEPAGATIPKKTYAQSLKPFDGIKTDENFFKLFFRPFPLFLQPAVVWGCFIQGTLIGWSVFIGVNVGVIFIGPPEFWNEVKTGYVYTAPFVGAILGFLFSGLFADWTAKWMTRRNGGVYEPEFRIVLVIPQLIFGCAGLYGFGVTASRVDDFGWFWPIFFFALEVMGMIVGAVASALYIVDAHRKFSPDLCLS